LMQCVIILILILKKML